MFFVLLVVFAQTPENAINTIMYLYIIIILSTNVCPVYKGSKLKFITCTREIFNASLPKNSIV